MLTESITALMIASLAIGQAPIAPTPSAPPAAQSSPAQSGPVAGQAAPVPTGPTVPAPSSQAIVIPAGTVIQLTLMSSVKSKSTQAGDTVRAVVAFPVTIGTQLAIPAGTFVDGTVIRVTANPARGQKASFTAHFTRLLFSNGYSVGLNGENTQALLLPSESGAPTNEVAELVPPQLPGMNFAMGEGQQTPLSSIQRVGPSPAVVGGAIGGGFAAITVLFLILAHHSVANTDFVLYSAGWQFQMVLDSPVTLDAAQVAAAAATPGAN